MANTILVIVAILLILYLKDFVLDMPYIINKQYSYAEGYVTEQSHGGADISSERRVFFYMIKLKMMKSKSQYFQGMLIKILI